MALTQRDPITTHVLDQTTGKPANKYSVTLCLMKNKPNDKASVEHVASWWADTSIDGRISNWNSPNGGALSLQDVFNEQKQDTEGEMRWRLRFDNESYWGNGKTFYPEILVDFTIPNKEVEQNGKKGHWHVPLLLGPWGYTTYRGS